MRDVIVIGAGGGGPVAAKELAARGLDVLMLEAGPRYPHAARDWTHYEIDANDRGFGYFRLGPPTGHVPRGRETSRRTPLLNRCPEWAAPRFIISVIHRARIPASFKATQGRTTALTTYRTGFRSITVNSFPITNGWSIRCR